MPPLHWWRTVFYLIPVITVYTIVLGTISLLSGLFDSSGRFAHRCAQWWSRAILATTGVRVTRSGAALPPENSSAVFVSNHASIYDIPILFSSVPRQLRIMAKATLGRVPFIGWHLYRAGHVLVDRSKPGPAIFKKMKRLASEGASVIVFPEGSRSPDGHVARFKGGVFLLAIESGLPIVPITVVNSRAVMPKGRLMTCPADVQVIVHDPIPTAGLTRDDARELATRTQSVIAAPIG